MSVSFGLRSLIACKLGFPYLDGREKPDMRSIATGEGFAKKKSLKSWEAAKGQPGDCTLRGRPFSTLHSRYVTFHACMRVNNSPMSFGRKALMPVPDDAPPNCMLRAESSRTRCPQRQELGGKLFERSRGTLRRDRKDKIVEDVAEWVDTEAVALSALRSFIQNPR